MILAEPYRGGGHNQFVDALLSREEPISLRDTDRSLARLVGGDLTAAGSVSEDLAVAHLVAAAVEVGGGLILTVDPHDIARLANPFRTIVVESIEEPRRSQAIPLLNLHDGTLRSTQRAAPPEWPVISA